MAVNTTVQVTMPQMGDSVTEGTVLTWHKDEGDAVQADETIVEISTDKVDAEVPAPAAGTIAKIHVQEGDTVAVGQVLAEISTNGGREEAEQGDGASGNGAATVEAPAAPAEAPAGAKASPVARRAAEAHGVDLGAVEGSGPGGRISKADVLAAAEGNGGRGATATPAAPVTAPAPHTEPLRGGAAMLARYMEESRSIPTATSFRTITVTAMDGRRRELKAAGQRVSFTHLIAYAIARAATDDMPVMAHHFQDVEGRPHRVDDRRVNLGVAVDVEKKDGSRTLMVP